MNYRPKTGTRPIQPRRERRRPMRFLFFVLILVLMLLALGFKLWELVMAILIYVYLGWCFKS